MKLPIVLSLILLASTSFAGEDDTLIYDKDWRLKYRVGEDGRVYDNNWAPQGYIKDGVIYDNKWNRQSVIKDDRVYDKDLKPQYQIKDDRIFDRNWQPKGSVREGK